MNMALCKCCIIIIYYPQLYHACDVNAWSVYYWCVLPFNVLSHCDFFASILSFVVTLVAMAGLSRGVTSFVHTVNVLFLVLAVEWQQHSMMTFFVPTVFCLVVVVAARVSLCCDLVREVFNVPRVLPVKRGQWAAYYCTLSIFF